MTDLDALLARADRWVASSHDWPIHGALTADLAAAVRDLRERHTTALAQLEQLGSIVEAVRRYGTKGADNFDVVLAEATQEATRERRDSGLPFAVPEDGSPFVDPTAPHRDEATRETPEPEVQHVPSYLQGWNDAKAGRQYGEGRRAVLDEATRETPESDNQGDTTQP